MIRLDASILILKGKDVLGGRVCEFPTSTVGTLVILRAFVGAASSRALCADGLCHYHRFLLHITGRSHERCSYCAVAPTYQLYVLIHMWVNITF